MYGSTTAVRIALVATFVAVLFGLLARPAAAGYSAQLDAGTLKLKGDAANDKLVLHLQPGAPGTLQADIGADGTADFSFDRTTFTAIDVDAGAGDDEVRVFQGFGAFFDEQLTIDGGAGDDTLLGGSGAEILNGGRGDDIVAGGDGNDTALLGGGNDRFTWNPGDDSDVVEGQGGDDRLEFNGSAASEFVGISANAGRTRFTRNIAAIAMDLDGVERIGFRALGGSDAVIVDELTDTGVKSVEIDLHASGGSAGDGQPDTVVAGGTNGPDKVTISSTAGNVLVDGLAADVQVVGGESAHDNIDVATSGGADTINAGVGITGPAAINVDGGDDVDTVRYSGTDGPDVIDVVSNGPEPSAGTAGSSRVESAAVESFVILGLAGADTIAGVGNLAPLTALTFDGGDDGDTLLGGNGADLLLGGKGTDFVDGNQGADRALMGPDGDTFQWDPGDGNDTVEGQGGDDRLLFNGSGAAETIDISADAGRTRLTRNIGAIAMDFDGIESVNVRALGGADTVTVNDLAGAGVRNVDVDLDLSGSLGGGDGATDTVVVNGTARRDVLQVTRSGDQVSAAGLAAEIRIAGSEGLNDTLRIQTLDGNDDVSITPDVELLITPVINLGPGE